MYLVINLGLKSIRGIIFNVEGEQLYSKAFPVQTALFQERVEQDATEWMELLDKILSDIATYTNLGPQIRFITATTSSSCLVGVNEQLEPATPVVMVSDKRASSEMAEIKATEGYEAIQANGLSCGTSSLIPKIYWFKRNDPETYSTVKHWLGAAAFINLYITGELVTDTMNAGKALYSGGDYEREFIERLGLDPGLLPEVLSIGTTLPVKDDLKRKYKFSDDCTFVLTTYDAICAVIGSTDGRDTTACDVSGTVTSIRVLHHNEFPPRPGVLLNQKLSFLDKYITGASNNLGGGIIEWYKQAFFLEKDNDVYFKMEDQAQKTRVGAGGIIFIPYLLGERAPFISSDATGTFFGIGRNSTRRNFTRAVFESTAYVTRHLIELIEQTDLKIDTIRVSGGLARFDLINQIKADVTNKEVHVVENFESTSIGAFILMAIATGSYASLQGALSQVVRVRKVISPSKANHQVYSEYFQLYKDLNSSLMDLYPRHKSLKMLSTSHESEVVRNL